MYAKKRNWAVRFFFSNSCELDEACAIGLRRSLRGPDHLLELCEMFVSMGKHGCSSNMALDNILAFLKQAARVCRNSARPSSERLIIATFFCLPHMKAYLDHGHEDHRRLTCRRMKTEGVPARMGKEVAQKRSRRGQHQARPHLSF